MCVLSMFMIVIGLRTLVLATMGILVSLSLSIIRAETRRHSPSIMNVGFFFWDFRMIIGISTQLRMQINSFARLISWEKDLENLARLLIRARVIDLAKVPEFIVLTEGEGFMDSHGLFNVK